MSQVEKNINSTESKKKSSLNDDFFASKKQKKKREIEKLQTLSEMESEILNNSNKLLYELTIYELYQNCKKTWYDIINEFDVSKIKSYDYVVYFFGKKNRKFYFGLSLIFFGLILYIFDTLLE